MADLLIDTDVFIDHLRGAHELSPGRHRLHYSVITRAELLAGNSATERTNKLLSPFREIVVNREIADRAGRIRRESGTRLPDALIAATALEHDLSLVTRNRSDFDKVRQLKIKNPDVPCATKRTSGWLDKQPPKNLVLSDDPFRAGAVHRDAVLAFPSVTPATP